MGRCKAENKDGSRCKNTAGEDSGACHLPSHKKQLGESPGGALSAKRDCFCKLYVSQEFFANGTQSYIQAYEIQIETEKDYNAARSSASRLLTNVNVCGRINELLEEAGLNDQYVDKQLLFMISQHEDFAQKMAAIREYNKLKTRITKNIDVKTGGEPIKGLTFNVREPGQ